jgi:3',5'-cyclic AMP phosphodiesterase CpdA
MGDSRGEESGINEAVFRTLLSRSRIYRPDFMLFLGDMIHEDSSIYEELENWRDIAGSYYSINRCFPCIGNHENDEAAFSEVFDYLPDDQLQGYGRTVYYFDYPGARFIMLNSCRRGDHGKYVIGPRQLAWLENVLRSNMQTHCFVSFHVPAYPTGAHYGKSLDEVPEMRDELWSIIDRYNVTAVFCGHEHNYSRRLINSSFNEDDYTFNHRISQIITGGAGAPLNSNLRDSRNLINGPLGIYHYIIVDVVGSEALFYVLGINNVLLDSFRIVR